MNLDWSRIVLNIRTKGVSAAELARRIGRAESVIQRLAREGQQPKFDDGVRILDVHYDVCSELHRMDRLQLAPR